MSNDLQVYSMPGGASTDEVTVASQVLDTSGGHVYLGYSTTQSGGTPTGSVTYLLEEPSLSTPSLNVYQHHVTGLAPNTTYYAKLAQYTNSGPGPFFGVPIRFRTHDDGSAETFSMKWAYGSCQANNTDLAVAYPGDQPRTPIQLAWTDLMDFAPDKLWDTGDFAYRGGSLGTDSSVQDALDCYAKQFKGTRTATDLAVMRQARALVVQDLLGDDHDFSLNNGESGGTDSAARQLNIQALIAGFAMYPYTAIGASPADVRGLYGAYNISPRIRVVVLDGETLDRSLGTDPDTSAKTFAGTPQDNWLVDLFSADDQPVLTIVICGKAWIGPRQQPPVGDPDGEDTDKPWSYSVWGQWFANLVRGSATNVVYLGGDRHALGYAPADLSNGSYHPFPVWLGSGWAMHSLPSRPANSYGPSVGVAVPVH